MKQHLAILPLAALLVCAGCNFGGNEKRSSADAQDNPSPPPAENVTPVPPENTVQPSSRTIDWEAARAEMQSDNDGNVMIQSGPPAPVPVLLPRGLVLPANAQPSYRPLSDGYFASYPGEKYDVVVNGTVEAFDTPNQDEVGDRDNRVFTKTDGGASVTLSRFGADYLVEFECRVIEEDFSCIDEDEAFEVVDKLIVVGSQ